MRRILPATLEFRRDNSRRRESLRVHGTRPAVATPVAAAVFLTAGLLQIAGPAGGLSLFIAGLRHSAFARDGRFLAGDRSYGVRYLIAGSIVAAAFPAVPVAVLGAFLCLSAWQFLHELPLADGFAGRPLPLWLLAQAGWRVSTRPRRCSPPCAALQFPQPC